MAWPRIGNKPLSEPMLTQFTDELTHLPLVPHIYASVNGVHMVLVMVCHLLSTKPLLNQCWLTVKWTLRNKLRQNLNRNNKLFSHENVFKNVVCEMAAVLSWRRWVYCDFTYMFIFDMWSISPLKMHSNGLLGILLMTGLGTLKQHRATGSMPLPNPMLIKI